MLDDAIPIDVEALYDTLYEGLRAEILCRIKRQQTRGQSYGLTAFISNEEIHSLFIILFIDPFVSKEGQQRILNCLRPLATWNDQTEALLTSLASPLMQSDSQPWASVEIENQYIYHLAQQPRLDEIDEIPSPINQASVAPEKGNPKEPIEDSMEGLPENSPGGCVQTELGISSRNSRYTSAETSLENSAEACQVVSEPETLKDTLPKLVWKYQQAIGMEADDLQSLRRLCLTLRASDAQQLIRTWVQHCRNYPELAVKAFGQPEAGHSWLTMIARWLAPRIVNRPMKPNTRKDQAIAMPPGSSIHQCEGNKGRPTGEGGMEDETDKNKENEAGGGNNGTEDDGGKADKESESKSNSKETKNKGGRSEGKKSKASEDPAATRMLRRLSGWNVIVDLAKVLGPGVYLLLNPKLQHNRWYNAVANSSQGPKKQRVQVTREEKLMVAASILAKCPLRKDGRRTVRHFFKQGNTLVRYVHKALNREYQQKPNFQEEDLAEADTMSCIQLLALIRKSESWEAITAAAQETEQMLARPKGDDAGGQVAVGATQLAKEVGKEGVEAEAGGIQLALSSQEDSCFGPIGPHLGKKRKRAKIAEDEEGELGSQRSTLKRGKVESSILSI